MRANDCLSTEYCPGKKCRGVKGENKIWTPTNKPVTSTGSPQVLDGSSSQPTPTSQAEPCPPLGAGWRHMEKAEEPVMLSEENQTAKCCVIFAEISHREWDAEERRVEGLTALVNIQFGNGMI